LNIVKLSLSNEIRCHNLLIIIYFQFSKELFSANHLCSGKVLEPSMSIFHLHFAFIQRHLHCISRYTFLHSYPFWSI